MNGSVPRARRARSLPICLAACVCTIALASCGGSKTEKGLVPVRGQVTLNGGPWPKPGVISFAPVDDKGPTNSAGFRPASAPFDSDGHFKITSFDGNEGLYPGTYRASVECWEVEPGMDEKGKPTGKSLVPAPYQTPEQSGFVLKVEPGAVSEATFDVKSK